MSLLKCVRFSFDVLNVVLVACALSSCISSTTNPYPSDWPNQNSSNLKCGDVAGAYIDPNSVITEPAEPDSRAVVTVAGLQAWRTFWFLDFAPRSNDRSIKSRAFTLSFEPDKSLKIAYLIDGDIVSSKTFSASEYVCEKGKLTFVAYERAGDEVYDMFPNRGTMLERRTIFRISDYLYVNSYSSTKAIFYGFFPVSDSGSAWERYQAASPSKAEGSRRE